MGKKIVDSYGESGQVNKVLKEAGNLIGNLPNLRSMSAKEIRAFYDAHKDDYIVLESGQKDKILGHMAEKYGDYLETDKNRIAEKKEIREEACKNLWRTYLTMAIIQDRFPISDRTEASLVEFDLSDEAFERNQYYCDTMKNGKPEDKKRAIEQRLASFKPIDFKKYDFADDRNFANNMLSFFSLTCRSDTQNIKRLADSYEIDLTEKKFENYCKDANMYQPVFMTYAHKLFVVTGPLYENTRFEKIDTLEIADKLARDDKIIDDPLVEIELKSISGDIRNAQIEPLFKSIVDLQNSSLTLQQRKESALNVPDTQDNISGSFMAAETKRNTEYANATLDEKLEMASRGEHLQDTPTGFFAGKIKESSHDLGKLAQGGIDRVVKIKAAEMLTALTMQREYTKDVLNNVSQDIINKKYNGKAFSDRVSELQNSTEFNSFSKKHISPKALKEIRLGYTDVAPKLLSSFEAFKLERTQMKEADEKQYYKTLLEENISTIKECDETFDVKEEDKAKIFSDDRIALHNKAKAFLEGINKTMEFFAENKPGNVPEMFARAMPYLLKAGDSEEIKKQNLQLLSDLSDQTLKGDFARKEILLNTLNDLNTIKPIDYTELDTDSKRLDFCMEQFNKCRLAFICQGDLQKSESSGFRLSDEAYRKFTSNSHTLENISTETMSYINLLASEEYLTMPTEQMSEHFKDKQVNLQLSMVSVQKNEANNSCMQTMFLVNDLLNGKTNSAELKENPVKPNVFTLSDFKETQPAREKFCNDLTDIRRAFAESYVTLKNADHFYNLKNSKEYTSLLESLERADFVLARQKDMIDEKNGPQLYKTIANVLDKAQKYTDKYANTQMNKTRQTRFDACTKLIRYLEKTVTPDKATAEEADYTADNRFTAFVKSANATAAMKKDGTYTAERVKQMRDFSYDITDSIDALKDSFKEGTTERNAAIQLKFARDELTHGLSSRSEMPEEQKIFLLAGMACLTPLVKEGAKPEGLTAVNLSEICNKTVKNPQFKEYAKTFNKEKIAVLLSGIGEKSFNDKCAKILNPETKTVQKAPSVQKPDISLNI